MSGPARHRAAGDPAAGRRAPATGRRARAAGRPVRPRPMGRGRRAGHDGRDAGREAQELPGLVPAAARALRPEAPLDRRGHRPGHRQRHRSRSSGPRSWATPRTSSSRASSASSCPAGRDPGTRSSPACARSGQDQLADMLAEHDRRRPASGVDFGALGEILLVLIGVYLAQLRCSAGCRPTSWPASPSGRSTGCAATSTRSSAGCRSSTSTATRAATS